MNRFKAFAAILALALLVPAAALAQADTGDADFTRYVAIGDSLTAGFASGGLVRTVQVNSYPALIWRQVTGGNAGFEQPLVTEPGLPGLLRLQSLSPLVIAPRPGQGQPANLTLPRPYNNLAVPGADVRDVRFTTTGGAHDLVLRNPAFGNTTALQQGLSLRPTFVSVWIGNNDALAAATSGIVNDATLTPAAQFEADYRAVVGALDASGADLVLANIPNVTTIPFVTTIPPVVVNPQTSQPVIVNGRPVPLIGPNGPLAANDFVLLTARAELGQGRGIPTQLGGSGVPLSDSAVLSAQEAATISARIDQFNALIATMARDTGAALVDVNAFLNEVAAEGFDVGGITYTRAFLTGGIFSLDGVHPTPFGYAVVANLFIDAINEHYDAEIPPVDLFPFMFGPEASAASATAALTDQEAAGAELSKAAVDNLFWALGVPRQATPTTSNGDKPGKPGRGGRGKPRGRG